MKLTMKIKQTPSRQLSAIAKRYRSLHKENVKVGYFEEQGIHEESGLSYASLMTLLEKGSIINDIPARPVFETTAFYQHPTSATPKRIIKKMLKELGTEDTVGKSLDALGEYYHEVIKDKFGRASATGNSKNSPSTIARKGKNTPLVDEGDLKANLAYKNSKTKRLKLG